MSDTRGGGDEAVANALELWAVAEVVPEVLLQPHGMPLNSKQDRIFCILCKKPNGVKNVLQRITSWTRLLTLKTS